MGHFTKVQCDKVAFKGAKYYTKCKGLSFLFFALRSGSLNNTSSAYALSSGGAGSNAWVPDWLAVRPALQLARNCHSERSEESQSKMGHFAKALRKLFHYIKR